MRKKSTRRILIVDDDHGLTDSLELRLQMEGYETQSVGPAGDALRELEQTAGAYDLVLMDQRLESGLIQT